MLWTGVELIDIIKSETFPLFQRYLMIANRFSYLVKFYESVS